MFDERLPISPYFFFLFGQGWGLGRLVSVFFACCFFKINDSIEEECVKTITHSLFIDLFYKVNYLNEKNAWLINKMQKFAT